MGSYLGRICDVVLPISSNLVFYMALTGLGSSGVRQWCAAPAGKANNGRRYAKVLLLSDGAALQRQKAGP